MEVVIAVAVIVIALASSIALISFSVSSIRTGKAKIIAVSLAQEGLEIVRNIRDSNWLPPNYKRKPENWRDGLEEGLNWQVQYNRTDIFSGDDFLRRDGNGFYRYDTGSVTPFKRKITIEYIGNNQIKVISEVTWQEKGRSYAIGVEDRLWNWLEEQP